MTDETYNGWANRETWALDLWLSNDQGLYEMTLERVRDVVQGYALAESGLRAYHGGKAVRELWEELTDPAEGLLTGETLHQAMDEVGSVWRIDWDEIGRHWAEAVAEEEEVNA